MRNVIFEDESVLVTVDEETAETGVETGEAEDTGETEDTTLSGYDENVQYLKEHPVVAFILEPTDEKDIFDLKPWFEKTAWAISFVIALLIVFSPVIIIICIKRAKKKKRDKQAAFERRYAEKTAFDHYSTGSMNTGYSNSSYGGSYDSYSNSYDNSYSSYNNYNNNNYNSGASSAEPVNPFAIQFDGKTPEQAKRIYLKYMKAFHSDTGEGSDEEAAKQINAAYDEYKKAHGIK